MFRILFVASGLVLLLASPSFAQRPQGKTHIGGKPSGMVAARNIISIAANTDTDLSRVDDGTDNTFVLPEGSVFVVTDVQVEASSTLGVRFVDICGDPPCSGSAIRIVFDSNDSRSVFRHYTTGVVLRGPPNARNFSASAGAVTVRVYGYFAKDK